jgi:hypothetical protein
MVINIKRLDIETCEWIEELLENCGLALSMEEVEEKESLTTTYTHLPQLDRMHRPLTHSEYPATQEEDPVIDLRQG